MAHVHGAAATSSAAGHAMGAHGAHSMVQSAHAGQMMATMSKHAGMGAAAAASTHAGKGMFGALAKHPLLVFGLGMAVGYFAHKYRKEIIMSATSLSDKSKDFILNQRENLEDLVAECQEHADDASSQEGKSAA